MVNLPSDELKYWSDLEVRLKDFSEERLSQNKFVRKVFNKLKDSESWILVIRTVFATPADLWEILNSLYQNNRIAFFQIYAARVFSEKILNNELIENKARNVLTGTYAHLPSLGLDDPKCLILPILFTDREAIIDLFYENLITRYNLKPFFPSQTSTPRPLQEAVDKNRIQQLLNTYERAQKNRIKRKSQIWRVISDADSLKIFFRREKRSTTAIKILSHNEFIKTADWKIFIFSSTGTRLDAYLGREPKRTLEIANYLANKLYRTNFDYTEKTLEYPLVSILPLLDALQQGNEAIVKLLGIRVKNAPLPGSPIIEIKSGSSELINANITDLAENHDLQLMSDLSNLNNIVISIDGRLFNLYFNIIGDKALITCSNKGYSEEEKRKVEQFFNSIAA